MSASFTRACPLLGIEDLYFHDLRYEGVSRLFEMDWDIPRVSAFQGTEIGTHCVGTHICEDEVIHFLGGNAWTELKLFEVWLRKISGFLCFFEKKVY